MTADRSVTIRLKVSSAEFDAAMAAAGTKVKVLAAEVESVGKKGSTGAKGLNDLDAAAQKVSKSAGDAGSGLKTVSGAADGASGSFGKLGPLAGLVAVGVTLIGPATAAATAGLFETAGAAGVAYLAYKGITNEMQLGTPVGREFKSVLSGLGSEFHTLESAATSGMQGGVLSSLQQVKAFLPTLEPYVIRLSAHLGTALNTTAGGLISGLKTMSPLLDDAGGYAEHLASSFAKFMQSDQFKQFIAYARRELPIVGKDLADIGTAAVGLITDLQPVGDQFLAFFDKIAQGYQKNKPFFDLIGKALGGVGKAVNGFAGLPTAQSGVVGAMTPHPAGPAPTVPGVVLDDGATVTQAQAAALKVLAAQYGATTGAVNTAEAAMRNAAQATAAQTLQMQMQDDAAGLLKGALDKLNGKTLSAADAQNAFDSSLANFGDHVTATGKKIHFTTTSINDMSSASVDLRGQLNTMVRNLEGVVEANGGFKNSTVGARAEMERMRQKIIDTAVAHGVDRKAATDYVDALLKIPKSIPPTKTDINDAAAKAKLDALKKKLDDLGIPVTAEVIANTSAADAAIARTAAQLRALDGATATTYLNTVTSTNKQNSGSAGTGIGHATGGVISGPGSSTSDSIPVRLSNGEFVVNAAATSKHRAMLEAINNGAQGFAHGGAVGSANQSLQINAYGGIVDAIVSGITSRSQLAAGAMGKLSKAMTDAFNLNGLNQKLAATKQNALGLRDTISQALMGAVNVATVGAGDNNPTGYIAGVGNIIGGFNAQTSQNLRFRTLIKSLKHKGLRGSYLQALEQQGLAALPALEALDKASKGDLKKASASYAAFETSAASAASVGSQAIYGDTITKLTKQQTALTKDMQAFTRSAAALANRPIVLQLNGKDIYKATLAEAAKAGRR
jgi:hypothetical protein